MAGYVFLEYMSQYAFTTILAFLLFAVLPIHFAAQKSWTASRIRRYFAYIFRLYFYAILLYVLVCFPFAYSTFSAPRSRFNKFVNEMRECAYRFEESECLTQTSTFYGKVRGVDRECFALAMCLRQPLLLVQIFFFFKELLATFLSGQSSEVFWVFTGTFVVWAMGNGWWNHPQVEIPPILAAPPTPPPAQRVPPSASSIAEPLVVPVVPQNDLEIQLHGNGIPEVGTNLAPPALNTSFPLLFQSDGHGELPRPALPPIRAHPNQHTQHPSPEILTPGPPGGYRVGQPTLPMMGEVIERWPQEPLPEWRRNEHGLDVSIRCRPELGDDFEDPAEAVNRMRDQIEALENGRMVIN